MNVCRRPIDHRMGLGLTVIVALVAAIATLTVAGSAGADSLADHLVRVTGGTADSLSPSVSDDGRFVLYDVPAFDDQGDNVSRVVLADRQAGTRQFVGPVGSYDGHLSADGSTAVFVAGRGLTCNGGPHVVQEVYRWQRSSGTSARVATASSCDYVAQTAPQLSADGRYVAYGENIYPAGSPYPDSRTVHRYDATTAVNQSLGAGFGPKMSDNGQYVAYLNFSSSSSAITDIVLRDTTVATGVAYAKLGIEVAPPSNDGRYLTFVPASGSVKTLDRTMGTTTSIGPNQTSSAPDMSPDGRFVAISGAADFGGLDGIGVWDRTTGEIDQIGTQFGAQPSLSANGRFVAYQSSSSEGVSGDDANGVYDIYLWTRPPAPNRTLAQSFVTAAYQDYIGRAPTAGELASGLTIVGDASSIQKRSQFTTALAQSDTYLGAVVNKLYVDTLGRPGDPGGVSYWTNELRSGRVTVAQAAGLFYASPEYFSGYGSNNLNTWVTDLYHKVLHRDPDDGGLAYYVKLANDTNRYTVAYPFYQSLESSNTRVKALYQHFLGRPADQGGLDYWGSRIPSLGDVALASNLTLSDEYLSRAHTRFP